MKTVQAYESRNGQIYRKKLDALRADLEVVRDEVAISLADVVGDPIKIDVSDLIRMFQELDKEELNNLTYLKHLVTEIDTLEEEQALNMSIMSR